MHRVAVTTVALTSIACGLGGCPNPTRNSFPTTIIEVDRIIADANLTPQERRVALEQEGLTPIAINALLRDVRLANQFGGNLRSAWEKVIDGRFQALTPDEIQLYGDEASDEDATVNASINDAQAQAVLNFFVDQQIDNSAELSDFLADPASAAQIPDDVPDDVLQDLFVDFDPERLRDRLP